MGKKKAGAAAFRRKPTPPPEPRPTGRWYYTDPCPHCKGSGRVRPAEKSGGWFIDYHYQDGHEVSGPYTKAKAVAKMTSEDRGCMKTLIGPDGQVYAV